MGRTGTEEHDYYLLPVAVREYGLSLAFSKKDAGRRVFTSFQYNTHELDYSKREGSVETKFEIVLREVQMILVENFIFLVWFQYYYVELPSYLANYASSYPRRNEKWQIVPLVQYPNRTVEPTIPSMDHPYHHSVVLLGGCSHYHSQ